MKSSVQFRLRSLVLLTVALCVFAACGGDGEPEDDRSFAPDAQGETTLPSETPAATSTFAPIDAQPGEGGATSGDVTTLLSQSGSTLAILSGLDSYASVNTDSGDSTELLSPRSSSVTVSLSPTGQRAIVIDRSGGNLALRLLDEAGKEIATWSPDATASPVASPASTSATGPADDNVAWSVDGARVAFWLQGSGLYLANADLDVRRVSTEQAQIVTALTFSPTGQSVAVALWNAATSSASIVTINAVAPESVAGQLLTTAENDGRFIRSMAWGNEQVGIVFALRSSNPGASLPNDLYMVPRFGEPMRLVASAGVAAPAAAVDQVAMASDGSTIAFSVLVPGEVGLRFHSVWVTNALAPQPFRIDTDGMRRITELAWTGEGLVANALRRAEDEAGLYQVVVVERFAVDGNTELAADSGPATPIASPVASPINGSPEPEN